MEDHVLDLVRSGGARPEGLLFHGTGESFDTPLRPGGYDGVLWTSTSPAIAQTYIPRAGLTAIVSPPAAWMLDGRIEPEEHSFWYGLARQKGFQASEVERDARGNLRSWRLPEGFPTYRTALGWLADLGYPVQDGSPIEVSMRGEEAMPADWGLSGSLYVTAMDGLRFLDASTGESDLTAPRHNDLALFRSAEEQGYDGIVIDDFMQDDGYGNVGHRSWGLFASAAARLQWVRMPAVRRPWRPGIDDTEDYAAFREGLVEAMAMHPRL